MSDLDDEYEDLYITDLVQDAVVADSNSEVVCVPCQFLAARRPGISGKRADSSRNPDSNLGG